MRTFSFLLGRAKRELLLTAAVMIIAGLATSALIMLINKSLVTGFGRSGWLLASFVVLAILVIATRTYGSYLLAKVGAKSLFQLRLELVRKLLSVPYSEFESIGADRALAAITSDINAINSALNGFPFFLRNLVVSVSCFIYMAIVSWQSFLFVIGFVAVGLMAYRSIAKRAGKHQRAVRSEWDALFGHFRGLVMGMKELKLSEAKRRDYGDKLLQPSEARFQRNQLLAGTYFTAANSVTQTLTFVMIGIVLFVLPSVFPMSLETQTSYALLLIFIITPFEGVVSWIPTLMSADVAMGRVEALGVRLSEKRETETAALAPQTWRTLALRGVTHTYYREREAGKFTLGPIDLTIERGEILFLVGGNGSGKTTLAKVLTGLYAPEGGQLLLDDRALGEEMFMSYRENFSAVFSDYHLFPQLLGVDQVDQAQADAYLRLLELDHKLGIEMGRFTNTDLSQGQRKRLALLASYLEDRPVFLFDEWAADQDPQFKDFFYRTLLPELKARGKTVIAVTHDDRYFFVADRVIKLENGQIAIIKDDTRAEEALQ